MTAPFLSRTNQNGRKGMAAGGWPQGGGRRGMASRDRVLIGWDLIDCGIV